MRKVAKPVLFPLQAFDIALKATDVRLHNGDTGHVETEQFVREPIDITVTPLPCGFVVLPLPITSSAHAVWNGQGPRAEGQGERGLRTAQ